ncbi:signal transduction histidine kinase/DNA-binding response OmpR family regulator/type III secretory pathway component EscS [Wenyingzhuangia heitensis]|uniref:histidine kinase n=1 Tax=Wenyingzhuangia heitensis TaxID=1487859 RepID=A0ABX0U9P6_9FLAO|nr:ATP-binding protein [Wenyingzhuangia heitensis]NIJ45473.1 signal transduction histidine kinase/DNA-binding response OmpR family regulator/type III secretory pathway component EscS [Wenyingzhuangia heitensis]
MQSPKHRITFKILTGYIILGILATIAGILVISEIKTFTQLQKQDISDGSKIVKIGSLIASIYENESLSRAALQLNSAKELKEYTVENEQLLLKIDSLNFIVDNPFQESILDSIKLIIDQKSKNIIGLKRLKLKDNSDKSIHTAINKLSTIDSLLGKMFVADFYKKTKPLDKQNYWDIEEYIKVLKDINPKNSDSNMTQHQIDSLLTISKSKLREAQIEIEYQRKILERKERELVENDVVVSRKLRELLNALEKDIIQNTKTSNIQREKSLNRSKNIILFAAIISFIIIVIFSFVFLNDFWKSERYRKKLEEANETSSSLLKSREQIISMVSHDLRTPLNTITGYGELLQKSKNTTKEINYVEHIQSASTYMEQLVNDLLEFSNLENNNISITSVPFDLEKLMQEIVKSTESLAQDKPITFKLIFDENIKNLVIGDPFRMKQILYNLVINAYKFTDKGTIILQSFLDKKTKTLHLSVKDTGIGIGKEQQKNIFKAFTQGENSKTNKQNGFGLGLTISKKISELLGGDLTLNSELNNGSTFTLSVPVTMSNKVLSDDKTIKPQIKFEIKVVVVEDDVSMRQLLKELLKQYGIESFIFENAQEALTAIKSIPFDLVLTDIQLPKMNGIHFMEVLKNDNSYKNQPIIAMTGRTNLSVTDYLDSGFSAVLTKPFSSDRLETVLQQFFNVSTLEVNAEPKQELLKSPEGFSIQTLGLFLNNDIIVIKNNLKVFLEDTKTNKMLLNKAQKEQDVATVNYVSHKMISMFKQLEVTSVVPFLEMFETTKKIDIPLFTAFENELSKFITSLENYLS